jgi:hypothetical protein
MDFARSLELDPHFALAAYNTAAVFALENQAAYACKWLKRAIELRSSLLEDVQDDEDFASIQNTPEFEALLNKMKKVLAT